MSPRKATYVVDSSVWIEIFGEGPLAKACRKEMAAAAQIGIPTLVLFEVYKKIALLHSETHALTAIATMSQHDVLDLTREIALTAADIAIAEQLPMADSIVLAHARQLAATLLTLDNDFHGLKGARVLRGTQ